MARSPAPRQPFPPPPRRPARRLSRRASLLLCGSFVLSYMGVSTAFEVFRYDVPPAIRGSCARLSLWRPLLSTTACNRGSTNDLSAISTLRTVAASQDQFRDRRVVDEDGDGRGEFGTFGELSGAAPPRGGGARLDPPELSGAFRTLGPGDAVARSGYFFRIYLTGRDGGAAHETLAAGLPPGITDPDASEQHWICYAWPQIYGSSGTRTYVIDETHRVFATDCARYSRTAGPRAAFVGGVPPADGNVWVELD